MQLDIMIGIEHDQVRQWLDDVPRATVRGLLCGLSYNPRRVIELRYGLADGHRYSAEETARVFGKTPGWVEEIETCALTLLSEFLFRS